MHWSFQWPCKVPSLVSNESHITRGKCTTIKKWHKMLLLRAILRAKYLRKNSNVRETIFVLSDVGVRACFTPVVTTFFLLSLTTGSKQPFTYNFYQSSVDEWLRRWTNLGVNTTTEHAEWLGGRVLESHSQHEYDRVFNPRKKFQWFSLTEYVSN